MISTMNKRLWVILVVLVVGTLGGLIWWRASQNANTEYWKYLDYGKLVTADSVVKARIKDANERGNKDFKVSDDDKKAIIPDHYVGNKDAKVVVIEYEDFACSHCAQMASTFDKIMQDYKDRVLFIYRNFNINFPNSTVTQSAAEAAYLLGGEEAFWKMHGLLFQDDSIWTGEAIPMEKRKNLLGGFARDIGLDVNKFLNSISSSAIRDNGISDKIERDKKLGLAMAEADKVEKIGTPMWFVNNKEAKPSDETIRKAIDEALEKVNKN